jgi:hypothetical protein
MDHEPQWESLVGSQNSIKAQSIDDDTDSAHDTDDLMVRNDPSSLANLAPLSSTSEVTLDKFPVEE